MKSLRAEIITIGNELLAGYTVNTNATFISQQLLDIGIAVHWVTTIRDSGEDIIRALSVANERADAVLISGGLGPTPDDITKGCINTFFNTRFIHNDQVFDDMKALLRRRNLHLLKSNQDQALVPEAAQIIRNPIGTAPGLVLKKKQCIFIFMPGVPEEMKRMMSGPVRDLLRTELNPSPIRTHLMRTTGITEAALYEQIRDLTDSSGGNTELSFLPRGIGIDLRFRTVSLSEDDQAAFRTLTDSIRHRLQKYIYTEDERDLQECLGQILREHSLTLATAESFTGGLITDWITNVPGSSDYFQGSAITYSNQSKIRILGVRSETLETHGAVSEETAIEMLNGVCERFNASCGIATTGIAGPGGGTPEKPVGLCYIAAGYGDKRKVKKFQFGDNRLRTKSRGAIAGLELLRRLILDIG